MSEDNYFLRCKVHSVRQYLFNFYLSKSKCKRPEVNSEPTHFLTFMNSKSKCKRPEVTSESTHFLTFMNNSKAFSSLDGMACSYQCSEEFEFLPGHRPAKTY